MQLPATGYKPHSSRGAAHAEAIDVVDCRDTPSGHVIIRFRDVAGRIIAEAHLPAFEAGLLGSELMKAAVAHVRRGLAIPEPTTTQIGRA
jgi:hypothetical protein